MNQQGDIQVRRSLKYKSLITVFSVLALFFLIVNFAIWLSYGDGFATMFYFLLNFLSRALLVLYVIKLRENIRMKVVIPLIFAITALASLGYIILGNFMYLSNNSVDILIVILFTIMAIGSLSGGKNKKIITIPLIINLVAMCVNIVKCLPTYEYYSYYSVVEYFKGLINFLAYNLSIIFFIIALFLLAKYNRLPTIKISDRAKAKMVEMDPEKALILLKEKFECGEISEEEYKIEREKVIKRI